MSDKGDRLSGKVRTEVIDGSQNTLECILRRLPALNRMGRLGKEPTYTLGADYVHLGQEDLAAADVAAIKQAGLKLGISTHSEEELAIALAAKPDYVALGPIYETRLKVMKWAPQGLERIREWKRRIGSLPLVAIGGITPERAPGVMAAGADSVAVITDFVTHPDPEARIREWVASSEAAATSGRDPRH